MPSLPALPTPELVTIYGADWCGDCRRAKRWLDAAGTPYRYVDLETDPVAQQLLDDAGYRAIPIIVTTTGAVLIEPSNDDLQDALGSAA